MGWLDRVKSDNALTALVLILLLALFLRVHALDEVPPGFFCDEASVGYNAYSILKTGKGEFGELLPVFFRAFGEYKQPLYVYPAVATIAVFGLNEFAVRLPAAIFGVLGVLAAFLLGREMFDERTGLFAALLLAVSPWSIQISRWTVQQAHLVFFITIGLFFLFAGVKRDKRYLLVAGVPFALALETYSVSFLFLPLLLAGFAILFWRELWEYRKEAAIGLVVFLIALSPLLYFANENPEALFARFNQVSSEELPLEERIESFESNYFSYYSLDFLFFKGDQNYRHSSKGVGELYAFELPLLLAGVGLCVWKHGRPEILLLWWLVIFPVSASLTKDPAHALRSAVALPAFQLACACFLGLVYSRLERKQPAFRYAMLLGFVLLSAIALTQVYGYLNEYYTEYPVYSAYGYYGFEYGNKQIYEYTESVKGDYERIAVTGKIHQGYIQALFYTAQDPAEYHATGHSAEFGSYVTSFDLNRSFSQGNYLYVVKPEELSGFVYDVKHSVYGPSGKLLYQIAEVQERSG